MTTETTGFDISAMKPDGNTAECEITSPLDGSGTGFFISVRSINDPAVKLVTKRVDNAKLKKSARGQNFTADEVRKNVIDILTAAVTGWRWGNDAAGNPATFGKEGQLPFNPGNLNRVLELDVIAGQIDTFMSDDSRFFEHLAKN